MTAGSVAVPTIIPLKAPSGPKHVIDSSTPVELRSDTSDTLVFYTVDGSRPNPFQKLGRSHTHAYKAPFTLSAGKVTIKALATSKDGSKQSSAVTKTFTVLQADEDLDDNIDTDTVASSSPRKPPSLSSQFQHRLSMSSRQSLASGTSPSTCPPSPTTLTRSTPPPITRHTTPTSRLPTREKHQPVCVYCNAARPEDPKYQYCTHCGARLPPLLSTPDSRPPLTMAVCPGCRAEMPPEVSHCLVCETLVMKPSATPVIATQADTFDSFTDKVVCLGCGTANRPNMPRCVTCEQTLQPPPPSPPHTHPPPHTPPPLPTPTEMRPVSGSSYVMCGLCGRINVSDARFCDWCGSKPTRSQFSVLCAGCSTPNQWHCRHCFSCGGFIKAPHRPGVEVNSAMKMPARSKFDENAWIPVVELEYSRPEVHTLGTQTHGLFYPSARSLDGKKSVELTRKMIHTSSRDRLPRVHSFSPGKGLWRMQMEHVCSHLKAFTQGSQDFQTSIGKAVMGKLTAARADKESDSKINIHLTFALKQSGDAVNCRPSSVCSLRSGSVTSLGSGAGDGGGGMVTPVASPKTSPSARSRRRQGKRIKQTTTTIITSGLNGQLAAELSGQGRTSTVEKLMQKGADVNAVGVSGQPMLSLAASNGHVQCLTALVGGGAKINTQAKGSGNTALHEAVLKGPSRIDCIETLLDLGASARLRNKEGLGACELANKLRHDSITKCFAAHVGTSLLGQLCKQHSTGTL